MRRVGVLVFGLAPGLAHRPGHGRETTNHLFDHTCSTPYVGTRQVFVFVLVGLVCVAIGWTACHRLLRRAEARAAG